MKLLEVSPQRDYLNQLVIDDVLKHLMTEQDPQAALRIALLLAINLLQAEDDAIAVDFCTTMLTAFPPLSEAFAEDQTHHFCGGYKVIRAKDENDNVKVLVPREYVEYRAGPLLDRSDDE